MRVSGKLNFVNDVTVPRQSIPELVKRVRAIAAASRLDVPVVAHAGDGNTHPVILFDEHERDAAFASASEMTDAALDLGGTITGEHGVGSDKLPHMTRRFTQAELASFRAIKRAFDPQGLLNPGILLPPQSPSEPVDAVLEAVVASALSGAPPQQGGSRIGADADIHVDEQNLTVEAGAAARCEDVRKMLRARRLHCPALEGNLTVGATVQSSAARPLVRPSLLAIEAEMAHGTVRFGGAAVKDVAGLDAKRLLCGGGGDAAIVRRVTFRLEPA
jgi:glycolate oxidase